jgi:nucleoside 2-deoxyribosyltransferase
MKVYLAGPLFNEMELQRNSEIKDFIINLGFDVYLPQEDAGISFVMVTRENKAEVRERLFQLDSQAIKQCDVILCMLDGRVPDEGTCIELGMAYAWNKICIGYKTDSRAMDIHGDNLMIDGCIGFRMARTLPELQQILLGLKDSDHRN